MKVGDSVRLKSGGPKMTIEKLAGDLVNCIWYEAKVDSYKREEFPIDCLELDDPAPSYPPSHAFRSGGNRY